MVFPKPKFLITVYSQWFRLFSKTTKLFSIMVLTSFWASTSCIVNAHISVNSVFKPIRFFLSCSPKLFQPSATAWFQNHFHTLGICYREAVPHFQVPKSVLVFYCFITNYQKLSNYKQLTHIILPFLRVRNLSRFSYILCLGSQRLNSRHWPNWRQYKNLLARSYRPLAESSYFWFCCVLIIG